MHSLERAKDVAHDPKRDPIGHRVASEGVQIGSLDVFEDEARPFFVAHHFVDADDVGMVDALEQSALALERRDQRNVPRGVRKKPLDGNSTDRSRREPHFGHAAGAEKKFFAIPRGRHPPHDSSETPSRTPGGRLVRPRKTSAKL